MAKDLELQAFIESLPHDLPYSELAERMAERFGPERAWSAHEIAAYWEAHHPRTGIAGFKIEHDPELRAFVDDRLGRLSLNQIVRACHAQFGNRTPSRSAIHRYWRGRASHPRKIEGCPDG